MAQLIDFDNSYFKELEGFYTPWAAAEPEDPSLILYNDALGRDLGLSLDAIPPDQLAQLFSGATSPDGANPLAQAYAGHQFGGFSPQLGDGRALLLGEVIDPNGKRFDIQLKGSGPTPYSRNGDGLAGLGPVLREYLIAEAMFAQGVPTTRALAAVLTGSTVFRQTPQKGAVLTRVAASHLRVGTFQFFAARGDVAKVKQLADYAMARHDPDLEPEDYMGFLARLRDRQAALIAGWMGLGFIHGVMNTDNMTISGETIDYGPCAFMDAYDPNTVYSSIDTQGRYRFAHQPGITQWNLARMAEAILPLIHDDQQTAIDMVTELLTEFGAIYEQEWAGVYRAKLGLEKAEAEDAPFMVEFLKLLEAEAIDFTHAFRALTDQDALFALFSTPDKIASWWERYNERKARDTKGVEARANATNPIYIPRNHKVEEALIAAQDHGDFAPFHRLLGVLSKPFTAQDGAEDIANPPDQVDPHYRTFCGT